MRISRAFVCCVIALQLAFGAAGHALLLADEPSRPPSQQSSTDDELRKSLEAESAQDYDNALLGDTAAKPGDEKTVAPVDKAKPAGETMGERLRRELGGAAQAEKTGTKGSDKPPMVKVIEAMREVQPRLARRDAGETTQFLENQIVHDLDQLVEEARKSCSSGQSSKGSTGRKPSGGSNAPQKTGGNEKVAAPHENAAQISNDKRTAALPSNAENSGRDFHSLVKRLWGELPEAERQQMLALPDEEFLPQYEEQTKQYLRRLSDGTQNTERQP